MDKEDRSLLIAIVTKVAIVCLFGGLAIKLAMGMSTCGSGYMAAFGYFLPACLCIMVIAIVISPGLAEKCSDSLFNFLYPQPKKVSKTYGLAQTYLVKEKYPESIKEYRKALEEDPKDVNALLQIADIYNHKLNDHGKAIPEYEKALSMEIDDNSWIFVKNQLADMYSQQLNEPEKAIAQLEGIIARFPRTKHAQQAWERLKRLQSLSPQTNQGHSETVPAKKADSE